MNYRTCLSNQITYWFHERQFIGPVTSRTKLFGRCYELQKIHDLKLWQIKIIVLEACLSYRFSLYPLVVLEHQEETEIFMFRKLKIF